MRVETIPARFTPTFAGDDGGTSPNREGRPKGGTVRRRVSGPGFRVQGHPRNGEDWARRLRAVRRCRGADEDLRFGDVPPVWACGGRRGRAGSVSTRLRICIAASRTGFAASLLYNLSIHPYEMEAGMGREKAIPYEMTATPYENTDPPASAPGYPRGRMPFLYSGARKSYGRTA